MELNRIQSFSSICPDYYRLTIIIEYSSEKSTVAKTKDGAQQCLHKTVWRNVSINYVSIL